MPYDEKGFTIIELLIVLGISSIIGTFGLAMNKNIDKRQLLITAKDIQTLIREVQQIAYGEQSTNIIAFYYTRGECTHMQNARIVRKVTIPANIRMEKTNFPEEKLYFRGHLAPSQGGTIVLNSKLHTIKLTVLPVTGRVKVYPTQRK